MLPLRPLLASMLVAAAVAVSGQAASGGIAASAVEHQAEPPPYRIVVGNLASDGEPAAPAVSNSYAYQGGAVKVTVSNAAEGYARVLGRTYPLLPVTDRIEGFVGLGVLDPPGATMIEVVFTDRIDVEHTYTFDLTVLKTDWTVDYIWLPPGTGEYLDPVKIQEENELLAGIYGGPWTPPRWDGPWTTPIAGLTQEHISSYFGEQRSFNGGPVSGHHGGTDIAVAEGTEVLATNAGTVVLAQKLFVRGNMVIVDHGGGVLSGYAHLSSIAVVEGQAVVKGQVLGGVGSTGLSTGPHLHWELAVAGILVDGLRWLDGTQGF